MAAVDIIATHGRTYTLDSVNEMTPWFEAGLGSGLAIITLEYSGTWNGTASFQGSTFSDGARTAADPITATNLNGAGTATSSTGGASAVEHWRIDLAGGLACRVEATALAAGSVDVTIQVTPG